jgi:hypothetical protein
MWWNSLVYVISNFFENATHSNELTSKLKMATNQQENHQTLELQDLRVPDFFPIVRKECREAAAKFFFCFTTESEQKSSTVS